MAANKDDTDEDMLIEEREDGSAVVVDPKAKPEDGDPGASQATAGSKAAEDGDDDHEAGDETTTAGRTEEEQEAIRVRRRAEAAGKKAAAKALRLEVTELRERNERNEAALAELHKRTQAGDLASLDAALKRKNDEYLYYQGLIAEGVKAQDGAVVANATHQLQNTRAEYERLARVKADRSRPPQPAQAQQESPNPKVIENAKAWHGRNSWYVPGETGDSMIAYALDVTLDKEGAFSKDSPEYFAELDKRIAKTLPHRAQKQYAAGANAAERQQQTPVSGSGREGGSQRTRAGSSFNLLPAQVDAMKARGRWADKDSSPEQRKAFASLAREYQEYNRANPPAAR